MAAHAPVNRAGSRETAPSLQAKIYVKPVIGMRIETKSGSHAMHKAWKAEFGAEVMEGWRQAWRAARISCDIT